MSGYLFNKEGAQRIVSATKTVEHLIGGGKIESYKKPSGFDSSSFDFPFKLKRLNANKKIEELELTVLPGTIHTNLWQDVDQTIAKGSHIPKIGDVGIDTEPNPLLTGIPENDFTVWLEIENGDLDNWIATRCIVWDAIEQPTDTPENSFYKGYYLIGSCSLMETGSVIEMVEGVATTIPTYTLTITQSLKTNLNHDKANFNHFWWL